MPGAPDPSAPKRVRLTFQPSPIPKNPLGEGQYIRTAAALIIGDEILNGKIADTNTHYFARFCFDRGIHLNRVEVVPDDEDDIIEAIRRLTSKYDLVVTSGGIGPTHDDITYASIGKAFDQPLEYHQETIHRMGLMHSATRGDQERTPAQAEAFKRMALFPANAEILYVQEDLCVPVVRMAGKVCILPGVPGLFERLLDALETYLPLPPPEEKPFRLQVNTTQMEPFIAPYLTSLQKRLSGEDIQVGSYPQWKSGVTVSLIGRNEARVREIGVEVAKEVQGTVIVKVEPKLKHHALSWM